MPRPNIKQAQSGLHPAMNTPSLEFRECALTTIYHACRHWPNVDPNPSIIQFLNCVIENLHRKEPCIAALFLLCSSFAFLSWPGFWASPLFFAMIIFFSKKKKKRLKYHLSALNSTVSDNFENNCTEILNSRASRLLTR